MPKGSYYLSMNGRNLKCRITFLFEEQECGGETKVYRSFQLFCREFQLLLLKVEFLALERDLSVAY